VVRLRSYAISWRTLAYSFIVSVVLFIIAAPLGDDKHGIGKNHPLVANIGNFVFAIFLISLVVLVLLSAIFLVQSILRGRN